MKTLMRDTSLQAYTQLANKETKEQAVYLYILEATSNGMDVTDRETAKALHWPINRVTPRRNSLVKKGKVCISRRRVDPETERLAIAWKVTRS